jgi:hypothetical protein
MRNNVIKCANFKNGCPLQNNYVSFSSVIVVRDVRNHINFLLNILSEEYYSRYLTTAVLVEENDNFFDNFNGRTDVDLGKYCFAHSSITIPI